MLPEADRIRITEERAQYKISRTNRYGDNTSSLAMSEITTVNVNDVNTVKGRLQILQQIIS